MKKLIFLFIITGTFAAYSQDAQFRGPQRDGKYPDTGLLQKWPDSGPQLIMSVEGIGLGWSQAVLDNGIIYVTGMIDTIDFLTAIDESGKIIWQKPYGRSWTKSYPDTRCTPTIDGDKVYVLNGIGQLTCFNSKDGSELWSFDVDKFYESKWPKWGISESPLIVDDKVIITPGGDKTTVVAFNKQTGKIVWESPAIGEVRSYVSAVIYTYKDFRYILAMTYEHIVAVDPQSGAIIWKYPFNLKKEGSKTIPVNSPLFKDDEIYLSNGYNYPSMMLKIAEDGKSVSEKWIDNTLDNHHHGLVLVDGYIYGSNWLSNQAGQWVCLKWETGEVQYVKDWFNKGPMIYADKRLYIMDEKNGNVGLVKPAPEGFDLISTFQLKKEKGEFWAHPSVYDRKLFLRYNNVLYIYNIAE